MNNRDEQARCRYCGATGKSSYLRYHGIGNDGEKLHACDDLAACQKRQREERLRKLEEKAQNTPEAVPAAEEADSCQDEKWLRNLRALKDQSGSVVCVWTQDLRKLLSEYEELTCDSNVCEVYATREVNAELVAERSYLQARLNRAEQTNQEYHQILRIHARDGEAYVVTLARLLNETDFARAELLAVSKARDLAQMALRDAEAQADAALKENLELRHQLEQVQKANGRLKDSLRNNQLRAEKAEKEAEARREERDHQRTWNAGTEPLLQRTLANNQELRSLIATYLDARDKTNLTWEQQEEAYSTYRNAFENNEPTKKLHKAYKQAKRGHKKARRTELEAIHALTQATIQADELVALKEQEQPGESVDEVAAMSWNDRFVRNHPSTFRQ